MHNRNNSLYRVDAGVAFISGNANYSAYIEPHHNRPSNGGREVMFSNCATTQLRVPVNLSQSSCQGCIEIIRHRGSPVTQPGPCERNARIDDGFIVRA
jgi:hypothetical protein